MEYSGLAAAARHVGAVLALLGLIGLATTGAGYLRHHRRMTECPLVIRHKPCCKRPMGNGWHSCIEVWNPDEAYTIENVELHVDIAGSQWSQKRRLLKWVGESPSKRNIAAGDWPHAEIAGVINQQPYVVFWHVPGALGNDPRTFGRTFVDPGRYEAIITITSQRKPTRHRVNLTLTTTAITIECAAIKNRR